MSAKGIKAGRAFVEIGVNDRLSKGLLAAKKKLENFSNAAKTVGLRVGAIGAAITAPLTAATLSFAKEGDLFDKASKRTGVAVEALGELRFAAELSGSNMSELETGLKFLAKNMEELKLGTLTAVQGFEMLGLSAADLEGLTTEEVLALISDRLAATESATVRTAAAMRIFGRSGAQLIPMLKDGSGAIESMRQQARDLGFVMSSDAASNAALLTDTLGIMQRVVQSLWDRIGNALTPVFIDLATTVTNNVIAVRDWIARNENLVRTAFKIGGVLVGIGGAILGLSVAAKGAAIALGGIVGAIKVGAALIGTAVAVLGPVFAVLFSAVFIKIGIIVAGFVMLGKAILDVTNQTAGVKDAASGALGGFASAVQQAASAVADFFRPAIEYVASLWDELVEIVGGTVQGIVDAIMAGEIELAFRVAVAGIKSLWHRLTLDLEVLWIRFTNWLGGWIDAAAYGLLSVWNTVTSGFEAAWTNTVSFLSQAWGAFTNGLYAVWVSVVAELEKAWIRFKGLFTDIDVEAEISRVDREATSTIAAADKAAIESLAAEEQDRLRKRELQERQFAAERDAILAAEQQAAAEREAALQRRIQESLDEEKAARDALDAALREAREAREVASERATPRSFAGFTLDEFASDLQGAVQAATAQAAGTFSAFAAGQLGQRTQTIQQRQLEVQQQIARNTREIADQDEGETFGNTP